MSLSNVKAIVLAAGKGERMNSSRAKVLHTLVGRPVVQHVVNAARTAGVGDVTLVVGYQGDAVRKAIAGVAFVDQTDPRGTGDAVNRCRGAFSGFDGEVLVLCGDAPLISAETIRSMVLGGRERKADAVMLTCCVDDPAGYGRIKRDERDGHFLGIVEEADATEEERGIREINSGAYVFKARPLFEALATLKPDNAKGEYYLTDVLRWFGRSGLRVETAKPLDATEVYGINDRRDLVAATNFLRWRVLDHHMAGGVTIVDPSTTFIEADVQIGRDTIVHPFCVIRAGVTIGEGCQVGPFAHLREGTVLRDGAEIGDYVETKNTTVGKKSKAKHLSYLGDATLGDGVNIGAGTITANYDKGVKSRTVIEDGVHTGCNTVLVAPVKLGKNSKTGAGAVVPRGQDVPAGAVVVGVPAKPLKGSGS